MIMSGLYWFTTATRLGFGLTGDYTVCICGLSLLSHGAAERKGEKASGVSQPHPIVRPAHRGHRMLPPGHGPSTVLWPEMSLQMPKAELK